MAGKNPHEIQNLVDGTWKTSSETSVVIDPMNGDPFMRTPMTKVEELKPFIDSLAKVPKSGMHNMYKNCQRYSMYGEVMQKAAQYLHDPEVLEFFAGCIQRVTPKTFHQAAGEMKILRKFCETFSGDSVRFTARGFGVAGDHPGQLSNGYRWPFGPVAVVSPFNFPLEICMLQVLSAVMMGNKVVLKPECNSVMPAEQFLRFMHFCGMPVGDVDLISCRGSVMSKLLGKAPIRMTQFTGSTNTAEKINEVVHGRMKTEDSGFDWKVMGPDVREFEYVAWQCDEDSYAMSGQKCSAQSILFAHENWVKAGLFERLGELSKRRKLEDLTITPVLSHTTEDMQQHVKATSSLPGARILFGGSPLTGHQIPDVYGTLEPTAVFVPLDVLLGDPKAFELCSRELFGPFQIVTEWKDGEVHRVLEALERIPHHLTGALVSNDVGFLNTMIGSTLNGTTYAGIRARCTGAPSNHWFGPAGDPQASGIGSPEAVLATWTCHREVIMDHGPIPQNWTLPMPT